MNCNKCGAESEGTSKYCQKCGERLVQDLFCAKCGKTLKPGARFCVECGMQIGSEYTQSDRISYKPNDHVAKDDGDIRSAYLRSAIYLDEYYKSEFQKILESNETYKGKWNWWAFFFGWIWALTKGAWLSAVISFVLCAATYGVLGLIYAIVYGMRGNYIYYCAYVKKFQQVI